MIPFVGFSVASGGMYPVYVDLVIPETVGHNFVVKALNGKLRSPMEFSPAVTTRWVIRCVLLRRTQRMR